MGSYRILVACLAQLHDVGGAQQSLITAGVGLVTVAAILERHLVLQAAFELSSFVTRQTGAHTALELESTAVANMRPVARGAAALLPQRGVNNRGLSGLGQEVFVAGGAKLTDRSDKLVGSRSLVTRRAVSVGEGRVTVGSQKPFGAGRADVSDVAILAVDSGQIEAAMGGPAFTGSEIVTVTAKTRLGLRKQGRLSPGMGHVAGAAFASDNRRVRAAGFDFGGQVAVTTETETLGRFGGKPGIG